MANGALTRQLYRMLLRHASFLDSRQALKAVIPHPLPFSYQVLLGGIDRDFFYYDASVRDAVRLCFRQPQSVLGQAMTEDVRLDMALQSQAQISKWIALLRPPDRPNIFQVVEEAPATVTYEEHYCEARQRDPELDRSLKVLEEAQQRLGQGADRQDVISLYEESIRIKPTADAHTYLGYMYSYDGDLRAAVAECQVALKIDDEFGNTFNDLGLYYSQMGQIDEAIHYWEESKRKRRYDVRFKPFLNLGHLYLELGQPEKALTEYVLALHFAGPKRGGEIREVVADMAMVLTRDTAPEG